MKEFKPKYISTNTGELTANIFELIQATIKNFLHFGLITRWEVFKNN